MADISNEELRKEITGKCRYPSIYRTPASDCPKTGLIINRGANCARVRVREFGGKRAICSCDVTTLARTYATKWRAPRRPLHREITFPPTSSFTRELYRVSGRSDRFLIFW